MFYVICQNLPLEWEPEGGACPRDRMHRYSLHPPGMLVPRASTVLAITVSRTPVQQPMCCATSTTSAVSAARNASEQANEGQPRQ